MKNPYLYLTLFILLTLNSCAKVYNSPDAVLLSRRHQQIAVLPPTATLPKKKDVSLEEQINLEVAESENLQREMIAWLLKRKMQNKIQVDILDVSTSNARLLASGADLKTLTPKEKAELLEVDAVIVSNFKLSKPMSTGAAIATTLLFGFGNTNEINVSMELHDYKTGKLIWNFQHNLSGGLFSTSNQLVDEVMRIASKKLPYSK
ncbi:MAG: hypothetical protein WAT92_02185, partial [Saprospiraceae bacterium]